MVLFQFLCFIHWDCILFIFVVVFFFILCQTKQQSIRWGHYRRIYVREESKSNNKAQRYYDRSFFYVILLRKKSCSDCVQPLSIMLEPNIANFNDAKSYGGEFNFILNVIWLEIQCNIPAHLHIWWSNQMHTAPLSCHDFLRIIFTIIASLIPYASVQKTPWDFVECITMESISNVIRCDIIF